MSNTANGDLYFYQGDKFITVKQGEQSRTVFRTLDLALAEHSGSGEQDIGSLLATDVQGSVLSVENREGSGHSTYAVYGSSPVENGVHSVLKFNGERREYFTGHYLLGNGYRAFNPSLMRFNSTDSLSPFGEGGMNAYAYCGGDPLNRKDPSGHMFKWTKAAVPIRVKSPQAPPAPVQKISGGLILKNNKLFGVKSSDPGSSMNSIQGSSQQEPGNIQVPSENTQITVGFYMERISSDQERLRILYGSSRRIENNEIIASIEFRIRRNVDRIIEAIRNG